MAVTNPPLFLQAGSHPAENFRQFFYQLMGGRSGIIGSGSLAVTQNGTPNMSVNVAVGTAFLPGTEGSFQGLYFAEARTVTNLAVTAADGTNPRYDVVVAKVQDAAYSGGTNSWSLAVVTGVAAATPLLPALPANCIPLARISVTAGLAAVTTAQITDLRTATVTVSATTIGNYGEAAARNGVVLCQSAYRPPSPFLGMTIFETDTQRLYLYSGSAWVLVSGLAAELTYTPVLTQGVGVAVTVNRAGYAKLGRRVVGEVHVTATGTGTAAAQVTVSTPIARANAVNHAVGAGYFVDASSGIIYPVVAYLSAPSTLSFMRTANESASPYLGLSGFTAAVASGDILSVTFSYEAS